MSALLTEKKNGHSRLDRAVSASATRNRDISHASKVSSRSVCTEFNELQPSDVVSACSGLPMAAAWYPWFGNLPVVWQHREDFLDFMVACAIKQDGKNCTLQELTF